MLCLSAGFGEAFALFRASEAGGEPLIFPTDTIYGMGAPVSSISANEKIYTIKNRPRNKPMPLLVGSMEMLLQVAQTPDDETAKWLATVWPGPYTVIFKAAGWLNPLYSLNGTVAVRLIGDNWLGRALKAFGTPITATSVNDSGQPSLHDADAIYQKYKKTCLLMLHGVSGRENSTIIDISGGRPEILRNV